MQDSWKWGISAIEAGFPAASPDSFTAVQEIAKALKKTAVTGLARSVKSDIDACYEALKDAKYPQVHVFIATSPIHRKFKLNKSKEEILEAIREHVSYARSKFEVVEFSPKMRPEQSWISFCKLFKQRLMQVRLISIFLIR